MVFISSARVFSSASFRCESFFHRSDTGRGGAKAKKELAYFVQRESHLLRTLHQRKPVQNAVIVATLSARALGFGKNPYLLVIADG